MDIRNEREGIRQVIKGIEFYNPGAITIGIHPQHDVFADKAIHKFWNLYKRRTGQRRRKINFVAVLEKKGHYHSHIITDINIPVDDWKDIVNGTIKDSRQIRNDYNKIKTVYDDGWEKYITKLETGTEEISIWEVAN